MTEYFTVENEEGDRIDRYLAEEMPERSRSYLQKLIKEQYEKDNIKIPYNQIEVHHGSDI